MIVFGAIIALIISFYLLAEISDRYFVVSLDRISEKLEPIIHEMTWLKPCEQHYLYFREGSERMKNNENKSLSERRRQLRNEREYRESGL